MIKKILSWSIVILTSTSCVHASAKVHTTPLTLSLTSLTIDQAVALALKHRPNLEGLKYAIQSSKWEARQELAAYFPQVGLTSITQQSKREKSPNTGTELAARQLVFQFGGPIDRYKVGQKKTTVVALLTESEKQNVRHEVEVAFLQAWLLQHQQTAIKSLQHSTTEIFNRAEHQNKLDLLDKKDWLKSNADYADDIATIGVYDNDTVIAERKLEFLLGERIAIFLNQGRIENHNQEMQPTRLTWNADEEIKLLSLREYYNLALKSRPDLAGSKKQIEIAHDTVNIIRQTNLPLLSIFGKTGHSHQPLSFDPEVGFLRNPRGYHQVGAQLDWNIFDGGLTHFRASKAQADKVKSILDSEQVRQKVKIEVEEAFYTMNKSLTLLKAREVRLAQAKNDLVLAQQNFSIGIISKVELSAAQTMWEQEYLKWLAQKSDAAQRYSDLLFACGYPAVLTL